MANQYTSKEGKDKYLKERIGKRFGKLIIIRRIGKDKHGNTLWKCKCDCGNEPIVSMGALTRGHTKSCGCSSKDRIIDIRGERFGRWLVLDKEPIKTKKGYRWICKCDCGIIKEVQSWDLRKGISKSCGCSLKLAKGESCFNWLYNYYKKDCAKKRGHSWELTKEQFRKLTKGNCYYCGTKPSNILNRATSNAYGVYVYNGIDRLDNSKSYTEKNAVSCCAVCNSMKSKLSKKEFLKQIRKIYEYKINNEKKKTKKTKRCKTN